MNIRSKILISLARMHPKKILQQIGYNWPYLALTLFVVIPLLWIAAALARRSQMFSFSGGPPTSDQLKVFLAFIVGGLGTAATMYGALLTRAHNTRERQRLRLEAILQSLQSLPDSAQRVAGVLPAMVTLGQEHIALRELEPMWENGDVDSGTATWIIDQIIASSRRLGPLDSGHRDRNAIIEATVLLMIHARKNDLTEEEQPLVYYFPGHFMRKWRIDLPYEAKVNLLRSMAEVLKSRDRAWWSPEERMPKFPTITLMACARHEPESILKNSAALLLSTLQDCFPYYFPDDAKHRKALDKVTRKYKTNQARLQTLEKIQRLSEGIRGKLAA